MKPVFDADCCAVAAAESGDKVASMSVRRGVAEPDCASSDTSERDRGVDDCGGSDSQFSSVSSTMRIAVSV